ARALGTEFGGMAAEVRRFAGVLRRRAPLVYAGFGAVGGELRAVGADVRRFTWRLRGRPKPVGIEADPGDAPRRERGLERGLEPGLEPAEPTAGRRGERTGDPVLAAKHVTVRFGGLVAVDDASLVVHPGEIVGLIGPNGAGKTTFFNAMAGFVIPTAGRVALLGADVTSMPVHERAARGMGRTFQVIQLFGEMTVRENLTVATHLANPSGLLSHLVVSRQSIRAEQRAAAAVGRATALLGIEDVLDRRVSGLPFGTLRLVELARALVTQAPIVMLDEPASGLDSGETERFGEMLRLIRDRLGMSLVLIEHDVGLVMSVCDYVYVLDRGALIAEGRPEDVRRNPQVVGAYLGTPVVAAV
ncbi:MAG: ABC transporter ATP-binding protein, partial [Actinomycetota bacterium]